MCRLALFLLFPYNSHRCHSVSTHVPRAPFIFLRRAPSVAVPPSSRRLFLSCTSDLPTRRSFSSKSLLFDDVYSSSSFHDTSLLVPLSAITSFLAALTTTSLSILRSSLYDIVALRFSPSRRGCNRASLSRVRYTRATDIGSRCPFLGLVSHRPRCTREFQLHRGATKKNTRCIFVAFVVATVSRSSSLSARGLFRLLPRSNCPSPSVIRHPVSLVPMRNVPCRRSPSCCRHVMLSTRSHHGDAIRLSLSILTQSPLSFL